VTYLGGQLGWYHLDQGAGFIGATLGAVLACSYDTAWWSPAQSRSHNARTLSVRVAGSKRGARAEFLSRTRATSVTCVGMPGHFQEGCDRELIIWP